MGFAQRDARVQLKEELRLQACTDGPHRLLSNWSGFRLHPTLGPSGIGDLINNRFTEAQPQNCPNILPRPLFDPECGHTCPSRQ